MMVRFGIVGAGWRVRWFLRAARALAGQLEVAGLAARRPQRAVDLASAYGVTLYRSPSDMIAAEAPDFVVTSVSSVQPTPTSSANWWNWIYPCFPKRRPPAQLKKCGQLWALQEQGARIQVAEQYWRQPHHAARPRLRPQRPSWTDQPGPRVGRPRLPRHQPHTPLPRHRLASPPPSPPAGFTSPHRARPHPTRSAPAPRN